MLLKGFQHTNKKSSAVRKKQCWYIFFTAHEKMKMKWILPVCLIFFACGQANNSGNDPATAAIDTAKQQQPQSVASPSASDLPEARLIVPGESVGQTHLGIDASRLEQLLGRPDSSDAAMGKAWLTWKGKGTELNIYTTYKDSTMREKVVLQIRTTSSFFSTAGGAKVGAPLDTIRQLFPALRKVAHYSENGRTVEIYDEQTKGIACETAASGTDEICTGIIVHKEGADVMDIYISPHPDTKRY